MSFIDKVVLVTGASSGIGAAIAIAFAKEGADIAMVGRNEMKLAAVEEKCASHGKPPLVINADVSKDDDAVRIVQATVDKFGKLDILINNAGISRSGSVTDGKLIQSFDELFPTNLRAPMQLTSLASPYLIKSKGNIINISGTGGLRPSSVPHMMSCVMKAALNNFTLGSALELSAHGVRVNAVTPGPVYTDILVNSNYPHNDWDAFKPYTALNRVSEPEEIADVVLFLASDKAKSITGANYLADNGMMLK